MSATATQSAWKSPSHSHSHSHSSHSKTSTTPRALPHPTSAGQTMSPFLSANSRSPQKTKDPRSPSPSYFGFVVGDASIPPDSNPGQHTRQNWDYMSPQPRGGAPATQIAAMDTTADLTAFRRASEKNVAFSLSQSNLSAPGRPSQSRQNSKPKLSSRPTMDTATQSPFNRDPKSELEPMDIDRAKPQEKSFFDMPSNSSPLGMSPAQQAVAENRHSRLSLPSNQLQTPPLDSSRRPPQRAETLPPAAEKDPVTMITARQLADLLKTVPQEVLLLDLRVSPQFAASRIRGALNLCIPTTLLKRPSFNIQKLEETFATENEKEEFSRWNDCKYIVAYDNGSTTMKEATTPMNVLKKFGAEGWKGHGIIIKGGFTNCLRTTPALVERGQATAVGGSGKQMLSIAAPAPSVAPVAGGCPMPTSKSAANPFFGNIRQNMDLLDGVGQMSISRPPNMSSESESALPEWLRQASNAENEGKLVSEKFLTIEKTEQKRMQEALSARVSYGSPNLDAPPSVQVAGIEKGSKNRYNNIFPFDHTRVRLQGGSPGSCDYINASHVKAAHTNKHYIATQAPIPATINDFWRLVWEQDVRVLVMLTAESEGGQLKSHPYWHTGSYGPLKLQSLSENKVSLETNQPPSKPTIVKRPSLGQRRSTNPLTAAEKSIAKDVNSPTSEPPSVMVRHFTLSHAAHPFQPMREIIQLHYSNWPDFGAPANPKHVLALVEQTEKYVMRSSSSRDGAPDGPRPVLVHCSAGCGRTGAFCTIDSVIDMLKQQRSEKSQADGEGMEVDSQDNWLERDDVDLVAQTVADFRSQRLSLVQNLRQFVLCYESVLHWAVAQESEWMKSGREGSRRSYQG